jgi:DNA invertase Pin-like site-specific DNA recombinase
LVVLTANGIIVTNNSMAETPAVRVVAYLRVSTDKQADHGVSLDAQRSKVETYAQLYDHQLVAVEVDAGVSAKTLDRPALQRALAMLKAGKADALLVMKLDRLTRSVRDLCTLVEKYFSDGRYSLISLGEQIDTRSAAGRLVINVLASVSQWEREAIGERTAVAMQHKAARREYTGGVAPYGFELAADGVRLQEIQAEQAIILQTRVLRSQGLSLRAVASALAQRGHLSRTGRVFAAVEIQRMLNRAGPIETGSNAPEEGIHGENSTAGNPGGAGAGGTPGPVCGADDRRAAQDPAGVLVQPGRRRAGAYGRRTREARV